MRIAKRLTPSAWLRLHAMTAAFVALSGCATAEHTIRLAERKLPEAHPPGTITVDCDTPGDHFSGWTYGIRPGGFLTTGELRFFELRPTGEQVAAARVQLGGQGQFVAIRFVAKERPRAHLSVGLLEDTQSRRLTELAIAENYDATRPIRFAIHWDGRRDVTVIVGQKEIRRKITVPFAPDYLSLSCSSALAVFSNVLYKTPVRGSDTVSEASAGSEQTERISIE